MLFMIDTTWQIKEYVEWFYTYTLDHKFVYGLEITFLISA